jgi:hypothetical protein
MAAMKALLAERQSPPPLEPSPEPMRLRKRAAKD